MASIVTTRIQLRVEGLRFVKHVLTADGEIELLDWR
jgi:hypothetical protein